MLLRHCCRFGQKCCQLRQHCFQKSATMSKQHCRSNVRLCSIRQCWFDIVAGVDRALHCSSVPSSFKNVRVWNSPKFGVGLVPCYKRTHSAYAVHFRSDYTFPNFLFDFEQLATINRDGQTTIHYFICIWHSEIILRSELRRCQKALHTCVEQKCIITSGCPNEQMKVLQDIGVREGHVRSR